MSTEIETKKESVVEKDKWTKCGAIIRDFFKFFIDRWYLPALAWLISGYLPVFYWGEWGFDLMQSTWWRIIHFPMFIATRTMGHFASHELIGIINFLVSYLILPPLLYFGIVYLIVKLVKRGGK